MRAAFVHGVGALKAPRSLVWRTFEDPYLLAQWWGPENFTSVITKLEFRAGGHHSGNWGGLLANPAIILAHAVATIASKTGRIRIRELKPRAIPPAIKRALRSNVDVAVMLFRDGAWAA